MAETLTLKTKDGDMLVWNLKDGGEVIHMKTEKHVFGKPVFAGPRRKSGTVQALVSASCCFPHNI